MLLDLGTLHTKPDSELLAVFDQLTEDLRDGSNLTEACFNMLQAIRTTVEAEMAVRGLDLAIKTGDFSEIFA